MVDMVSQMMAPEKQGRRELNEKVLVFSPFVSGCFAPGFLHPVTLSQPPVYPPPPMLTITDRFLFPKVCYWDREKGTASVTLCADAFVLGSLSWLVSAFL